jgi:hypothetical protein
VSFSFNNQTRSVNQAMKKLHYLAEGKWNWVKACGVAMMAAAMLATVHGAPAPLPPALPNAPSGTVAATPNAPASAQNANAAAAAQNANAAVGAPTAPGATAHASAKEAKAVPGELIIHFKKTATDAEIADALLQGGLEVRKHIQTPVMKEHGHPGLTRAATHLSGRSPAKVARARGSGIRGAELYLHAPNGGE